MDEEAAATRYARQEGLNGGQWVQVVPESTSRYRVDVQWKATKI